MTNESQQARIRPWTVILGGVLLVLIVGFLAFIALYAWADIH
jgi:hypothetical protein